jgi:[ribosomal protein S5]-alanine N-acetyltransferase
VLTELRTPRLLLRRACPADLEGLHAVLSDERAMTYWSSPPHSALQQTREWLDSMIASTREESDDFVVTFGGETIGKIGAYRLPDFGYILAPAYWGRGLASEAMTAFLAHVFNRPDVARLTVDIDPRNHGSLRLVKRHGFIETGRASGTWTTHIGLCDSIYLALEKADYLARRENSSPR